MDDLRIRELPEKFTVNITDKLIVEDEDGTKIIGVDVMKSMIDKTLFCNTVNDLKKGSYKEGDIVTTLGYDTVNDGGSGTYRIEYDPTALEDGGTCLYLKTSDTLRAKLLHNGIINVMQFGVIGDGKTDDYANIVKAMNTGLQLYFPEKTY